MKKYLSTILILALLVTTGVLINAPKAHAAISLVAHIAASGASPTTAGINTSGATLLVVSMSCFGGASSAPTDSNGNTWHEAKAILSGNESSLWYAYDKSGSALVVGAGQTFSGGSNIFGLEVEAFSGTLTGSDPLDQTNGALDSAPLASWQPGSITPGANNEVVISYAGVFNGSGIAVDSSMTITDKYDFAGGISYQQGLAYIVQTTAAAINPTWSNLQSTGSAVIASYKAGATSSTATPHGQLMINKAQAIINKGQVIVY